MKSFGVKNVKSLACFCQVVPTQSKLEYKSFSMHFSKLLFYISSKINHGQECICVWTKCDCET